MGGRPFCEGGPTLKVLVNGCFDCLHDGHRAFLKTAAQFGELFIGVNSDTSVREMKGPGRPIQWWWDRVKPLCAFGRVFGIEDSDAWVRKINPDIIVRGWDQTISDEDRKHIVVIVPRLTEDSTTKNLENLVSK
jgi:cytidyltransferase-like protein